MSAQMVWGTFALVLLLVGLGVGLYVTVECRREKSLNIKAKANAFIALGSLEGIILAILVFTSLLPIRREQLAAVTKALGPGLLFNILFAILLVGLHTAREKKHLPKFVWLLWLEYFISIVVFLAFGITGLVLANSALDTLPGTQTPTMIP